MPGSKLGNPGATLKISPWFIVSIFDVGFNLGIPCFLYNCSFSATGWEQAEGRGWLFRQPLDKGDSFFFFLRLVCSSFHVSGPDVGAEDRRQTLPWPPSRSASSAPSPVPGTSAGMTDHCLDEAGGWDSAPREETPHSLPGLQVHGTLAAHLQRPQASSQHPGSRCYCWLSPPATQPEPEGAFIPNEGSQLNFQIKDFSTSIFLLFSFAQITRSFCGKGMGQSSFGG